jgi:hypothetical protein
VPVARLQGDQLEVLGRNGGVSASEAERHLRSVRQLSPGAGGRRAVAGGAPERGNLIKDR